MKKHLLFGVILFFCHFLSFSQENKIDSLQKLLQNAKHDTLRLQLYLALCEECDIKDNLKYAEPAIKLADKLISEATNEKQKKKYSQRKVDAIKYVVAFYQNNGDTSKVFSYNQEILSICQKMQDTINIRKSFFFFVNYYSAIGNLPKALEYCQNGLSISQEMNDKIGIGRFFVLMGQLYGSQGDTIQELSNYKKSVTIYEKLKDTSSLANIFIQIGNFYGKGHNVENGIDFFQRAISLYEKYDSYQLAWVYNAIGTMYVNNNDFNNGLINFQKGLSFAEKFKNKDVSATILGNTGVIYYKQLDLSTALDYFYKALKIQEEIKNESGIASSTGLLARTYMKQKNYQKAKKNSYRSLSIWKKFLFSANIRDAELLASQIDSASGNNAGAYEHYKQYIIFRDKLKSEEVSKASAREKIQNEYDKQKAKDKAEQDKKDLQMAEEKRRQKIITYSVTAGLFLVLLLALFIFRGYKQKQKSNVLLSEKNKIIEEKNKDITDSINYAKRIQQAKLPDKKEICSTLTNSFVLFKPKDIVSGDFYYFHKNDKSVFIASADCTGHGVPGAFMSMIGSEKLDDALAHSADTSEILSLLNKGIKNSLHQTDSDESTRDGMDIALCSVDTDARVVKYAGANRPLWIIRNGQTVVEEIKATKKAIGGFTEDSQHFDTHVVQLQHGDTFYIFSDGYADTFSGADSKKLTTKRFKEILLSIQDKSMQDQELHLDNFVENWKAGTEQVDDILVIGIRL